MKYLIVSKTRTGNLETDKISDINYQLNSTDDSNANANYKLKGCSVLWREKLVGVRVVKINMLVKSFIISDRDKNLHPF